MERNCRTPYNMSIRGAKMAHAKVAQTGVRANESGADTVEDVKDLVILDHNGMENLISSQFLFLPQKDIYLIVFK